MILEIFFSLWFSVLFGYEFSLYRIISIGIKNSIGTIDPFILPASINIHIMMV